MDVDVILRGLGEARVLPILRTPPGGDPLPAVEILAAAGFRAIELTFTSPDPLGDLERARATVPGALLGMGTVTSVVQMTDALAAGADFVVMPVLVDAVLEHAQLTGVPIVGAGLSPSELFAAAEGGAMAVKVFPAGRMGPSYLRDLAGPFPGLKLLPTGGIAAEEVPSYLQAGALAVGLGGQLVGDACAAGGDLVSLGRRLKALERLLGRAEASPASPSGP